MKLRCIKDRITFIGYHEGVPLRAHGLIYSPDERKVHDGEHRNSQQGDGVWLVEEVQERNQKADKAKP